MIPIACNNQTKKPHDDTIRSQTNRNNIIRDSIILDSTSFAYAYSQAIEMATPYYVYPNFSRKFNVDEDSTHTTVLKTEIAIGSFFNNHQKHFLLRRFSKNKLCIDIFEIDYTQAIPRYSITLVKNLYNSDSIYDYNRDGYKDLVIRSISTSPESKPHNTVLLNRKNKGFDEAEIHH